MQDRPVIGRAIDRLCRGGGIEAENATGKHPLRVRILDDPSAILPAFKEPASIHHDDLFGTFGDRSPARRHSSGEAAGRATACGLEQRPA